MLPPDDRLNAFVSGAQDADLEAKSGPLSGLTLAVKDIFDVKGQRTGGGNPQMLAQASPATATMPAIRALVEAGARFVGRTQTDELTFSLMGHNAHYPQPVNPAAPERVTGGSSSGSAAAVAGGLADIAAGSDTGGSIRAPASFCGLIGLRTTHGAIPLGHAMPLAPSLDTFGWFAKDAGTYDKVGRIFFAEEKVARPGRLFRLAALDALVLGDAEAAEYRRMLHEVEEALGPAQAGAALAHTLDELYWTFRRLQAHEAWQVHGAFISAGHRQLGPGVRERFEFGKTVTDEEVREATRLRDAFRAELAALLGDDGLLVLPTVPGAAPRRDAGFDDQQAYRERALRLLCLSGLSGFPQITAPLGAVDGAPFGISLLGPAGSDMALIRLARRMMETG